MSAAVGHIFKINNFFSIRRRKRAIIIKFKKKPDFIWQRCQRKKYEYHTAGQTIFYRSESLFAMNILIVIDQYDAANNGTTISARRFAEALKRRGNTVKILSTGEPGDDKYQVRELRMPPVINKIIKEEGMTFAMPNRQTLTEAIEETEIVHFYMPFALSRIGLSAAERLGVPHTTAFHVQPENITYAIGAGKMEDLNHLIYKFFRDTFYNRFTHIHCPSSFIANKLAENGYTAKLHVISNGVDPDFVYRKMPKNRELEGKFVILMTGRLSNEKRQDILIDAVRKSRYEKNIQLVLAGHGPNEQKYRERGDRLTNKPIIRFFAKQELIELIAMSDLYVHASDAEIEAISCMEAFCSGLVPLISNSPNSATPQFALDNRSLFECGSSDSLADKIDYWYEHGEERRAMELKYSEYGKQYNIDNCVGRIENMFAQAIAEKKV